MADDLGVHTTNVQRDYVFGWVLAALYTETSLKESLHLKGGNCLRKAYLPQSRFSPDLDLGAETAVSPAAVKDALDRVCDSVGARAGVAFWKDRTRLEEKRRIQSDLSVYEARLYFRDFYGEDSKLDIAIRLDVTEYERLALGSVQRPLIHAYSDQALCQATLRCVRMEELLASKLKCLLQRRHVADLYDLVHWILFSTEPLDRAEILRVFLRKTIYQPAPGVARELLQALPFDGLRTLWDRFIVCARSVAVEFESGVKSFLGLLDELFGRTSARTSLSFFPAHLRTPILEAGSKTALLQITYDGVERLVEPYSLRFKRRADGGGGEYFYVYDRTGGSSGPGIKTLVAEKVSAIKVTEEKFDPRHPIELSKAGDPVLDPTFRGNRVRGGSGSIQRTRLPSVFQRPRVPRVSASFKQPLHRFKCSVCGKTFARKEHKATLNRHKGKHGFPCLGTLGVYLGYR